MSLCSDLLQQLEGCMKLRLKSIMLKAQTLRMWLLYLLKTLAVLNEAVNMLLKFLLTKSQGQLLPSTYADMSCFPSLSINLIVHKLDNEDT
ncbi:hypothetical protein Tco_1485163 [Tanacetum coccineum]